MGKPKKPKKPKRKPSAYNKHIGREMRAGKTMKQAAASWKKKGNKPKSGGSRQSSSTTRRSNTTMGRRGGFSTQKLYKIVRLAALVAPAAGIAMKQDTMENKIHHIMRAYTGYNSSTGQFNFGDLAQGYGPILGATLATYGIPKIAGLLRGL